MKILGMSFSPREQGNTELLMERSLAGARDQGADTELCRVADRNVHPCTGCGSCFKTGMRSIKDDMQEICEKMLAADGILFGSPVYFYNITAQGKAVIDRTLALGHNGKGLANKVGGIIVVGGSLGLVDAVKDIYFYIVLRQMIPANFVAAYASNKGDVTKLAKGMKAAEELGVQMVKIAERKFEYPMEIKASHIGFGTHTW